MDKEYEEDPNTHQKIIVGNSIFLTFYLILIPCLLIISHNIRNDYMPHSIANSKGYGGIVIYALTFSLLFTHALLSIYFSRTAYKKNNKKLGATHAVNATIVLLLGTPLAWLITHWIVNKYY